MPNKISLELGEVQKTLLLPLWGRAVESQRPHPRLIDKTAVDIIRDIDFDFAALTKNISSITRATWIQRSLYADSAVKKFLAENPTAAVVNVGCGLDTTFDRVDNGKVLWYDLDLPDVIKLRLNFICESARRKFIACSVLNEDWTDEVPDDTKVMFLAAGVLYYFPEPEIRSLIRRLADRFPCSELVFDAASPRGVKLANKVVIKKSGMDDRSFLRWGIENAKEMESWDSRISVVDQMPIFRDLRQQLAPWKRVGPFISDILKIQFMVHLRFSELWCDTSLTQD